jgi:FKBP-type peptidyl-prolyl cis-trans isomerase SlyD
MSPITAQKVISIDYTLTNNAGEEIDSSKDRGPLLYLQGAGNIIPGLEQALAGKIVGDNLNVSIRPEDAYGRKEGPGPQPIPRDAFPPSALLEPGVSYVIDLEEGGQRMVWIAQVTEQLIFLDSNHPLAGETLHFDVTVRAIRNASAEELEHGHPHSPAGCEH